MIQLVIDKHVNKKTNEQDLIVFIKKAADMIEDDDFSEETQEIIDNVIIGDSEPKKQTLIMCMT